MSDLSLFYDILTAAAVAVLVVEDDDLLPEDDGLEYVEGEWDDYNGEDRNEEVVECRVIVIKKLLFLSVEIILEARHLQLAVYFY
jgi:hypothetical protein